MRIHKPTPWANRQCNKFVLALAALLGLVTATPLTQAQYYNSFKVLHYFDLAGGVGTGYPFGLVADPKGNLYGTAAGGAYGLGEVYKLDPSHVESRLYSFPGTSEGANPNGPLTLDGHGNLYGTTAYGGGEVNDGTLFKIDTAGFFTTLYRFGPLGVALPTAPVVIDALGNIYGSTYWGPGLSDRHALGTIYKFDTSGNATILSRFYSNYTGVNPSGLLVDAAGNFYGTAFTGTGGFYGNSAVIFKVDSSGNETILHHFPNSFGFGPILLDSNGNIYGTSGVGGTNNVGILYKVDPAGNKTVLYNFSSSVPEFNLSFIDKSGNLFGESANAIFEFDTTGQLTTLYNFPSSGSACPNGIQLSGLIQGPDGNLYGTASSGGIGPMSCTQGYGTVFELSHSTAPQPQISLSSPTLQFSPIAVGSSETLSLTVTNTGGGTLSANPSIGTSQSYSIVGDTCTAGLDSGRSCTIDIRFAPVTITIHDAILLLQTNTIHNPSVPLQGVGTGVSADVSALQFGTVSYGSSQILPVNVTNHGIPGVVTLQAVITGVKGAPPSQSFQILDTRQNTCLAGIASKQSCSLPVEFYPTAPGAFQELLTITPSGGALPFTVELEGTATPVYSGPYTQLSFLHVFTGGADGAGPVATVTADSLGNLYGTTQSGGVDGAGVVFKLDPTGRESVLYTFTGGADGGAPQAPVILDAQGNLYGTTNAGGSSCSCGVVFKLDPSGKETVLHAFLGGPSDGAFPAYSGVVTDALGNLYGTTVNGGAGAGGPGTVYKINPGGAETLLYSFTGGTDGAYPEATPTLDSSGNLYGTANQGGDPASVGTLFKIDSAGHETTLHKFTGSPKDGAYPDGPLLLDKQGNLYGTTLQGGNDNFTGDGTIFQFTPAGVRTLLASFASSPLASPSGSLVHDKAGNFYGFAHAKAGAESGLFKIDTMGNLWTLMFSCRFGHIPQGGLTSDAQGNLYGTTFSGGESNCSGNLGTVFKLTPTVPSRPTIELSATTLDFGSVMVGSTATLTLTITNAGSGTLPVAPSLERNVTFAIVGSTCGTGVTAGASCTLQIQFSPTSFGYHSRGLYLRTNLPVDPVITLLGYGTD
jgi:uncharacterized repeat protein (TIGR03803 family)